MGRSEPLNNMRAIGQLHRDASTHESCHSLQLARIVWRNHKQSVVDAQVLQPP